MEWRFEARRSRNLNSYASCARGSRIGLLDQEIEKMKDAAHPGNAISGLEEGIPGQEGYVGSPRLT
jgi:hypothetical protein